MNVLSLTIPYAQDSIPDDPWWIAVEQLPVDNDVATITETAELLDKLFSIEACQETSAPAVVSVDEVVAKAATVFDYAICSQMYDGSCEVQVKVYRSHQGEAYRLHVAGGVVVGTKAVQEMITVRQKIEAAGSFTLPAPVVFDFSAGWATRHGDLPVVNRTGNTLYWAGEPSGTVVATYLTTYDLVIIRVYGVDGEQGAGTVRVVYHGLVDDLELEMPDPADNDRSLCPSSHGEIDPDPDTVTCYTAVTVSRLCGCSGAEVGRISYDRIDPCPEAGPTRCPGSARDCMHLLGSESVAEYVRCSDDNQIAGRPGAVTAVSDPEYYKDQCCEYPTATLPQCVERVESYTGGRPIKLGEAYYRGLYGDNTRFVPVSPKGNCGQHIIRQVIDQKDCCDRLPPLVWDDAASPDYIAANSTVWVYVRDGLPPYKWHISSEQGGVWFVESGGSNHESETPFAALVAGDTVCGTHTIEVVDDCGTVVFGAVLAPDGHWERGEVILPRNIAASGYLHLGHGEWVTDGGTQYIELQAGGVKYRQGNGWCSVDGAGPHTDTGVGGCPSERSQYLAWWGTDPYGEDTAYRPLPKIDETFVVSADCAGCYGYDRYGVLSFDWADLGIFGAYTIVVTGQSDYLVGETVVVAVGGSCRMSQYRKCYGELEIWRWKC